MTRGRRRILFATEANDAFVERIEASLARATVAGGEDLLVLVEGRDPTRGPIPTIDLEEMIDPGDLPTRDYETILKELGRLVEDTRWYAEVREESADRVAIEDKLVAAAWSVDRILAEYGPGAVLVWNGLLGVRGVVADRARRAGIPVWYCEKGPLPESWYADDRGVNAASSIAGPPLPDDLRSMLETPLPNEERAVIEADIAATARAGASAWEQAGLRGAAFWRMRLGLDAGRPVLFFPMQVDADTNMRFFSPHFSGSLTALQAVAKAAESLPDWFLLVKPHPKGSYPTGVMEALAGDRGRCVPDINLHDALALSSAVVTINSTVAAEAAWNGKPVLQLGRGILSGKGIVAEFDAARPLDEQLQAASAVWRADGGRRERGLRFYEYLKNQYLMRADEDDDVRRLIERMQTLAADKRAGRAAADARMVADGHVWLPAKRLLDHLAVREPRVRRVVLAGYGRNARRLWAATARYPFALGIEWLAWDDAPEARARAASDGLSIWNPSSANAADDVLIVVTPRNPQGLADKLECLGYEEGDGYRCLFGPVRVLRRAALV
ncbi:MAG: hypothetical protein HY718_19275 [Planctomycetes bacterium]|nr:hypothetical protein [Planctomycetota bacterium]